MKETTLLSNRLDDSNELVNDNSNSTMKQNETATQKLANPSTPIAGFLARVVKGVVSFLQNLLSYQTRKEGVRRGQEVFRLRELSQTTAIGTLYGLFFAGLILAPLPLSNQTAQAQNFRVPPIDSLSGKCYPPPSLSFPWLSDYGFAESDKNELFCAIWDGEALTVTFVIEMPWYFFNDGPRRRNSIGALGYLNYEIASWDDLVNVGSRLDGLKNAIIVFERKTERYLLARAKCDTGCTTVYSAAALACLAWTNPKFIVACEVIALAGLHACFLKCDSDWDLRMGDIRDDLEDVIRAL